MRRALSVRLGAKLPNSGPHALELGVPELARTLERAGFDSVWVGDHVVMPAAIESRYPFAADGRATWATSTPYVDAIVALALAAAVTTRVTLGTAVLVLPLRHPVILAKQVSSIDVAAGGRVSLGVGAGWLREEFAALNVPFENRGARLEEWIAILRACWTGRPPARSSELYDLPPDVLCLPPPAHPVPVLVGGHSRASLRRAGAVGDGWLGQQSLDALDLDEIVAAREAVEASARAVGRVPERRQTVLRIVDSAGRSDEVARRLPELGRAGVDEIVVDVAWAVGDPAADVERLRSALP